MYSVENENIGFIVWSGLINCYWRKNGQKDQVTVASVKKWYYWLLGGIELSGNAQEIEI